MNNEATEKRTVTKTDSNGITLTKTVSSTSKDSSGNPIISTELSLKPKSGIRNNVVIALDVSYSMVYPADDKYYIAIAAIEKMLLALGQYANCNVGLVMFSDYTLRSSNIVNVKNVVSGTSVNESAHLVRTLKDYYPNQDIGNTNYEDALYEANNMLQSFSNSGVGETKNLNTIVLVTDGIPTRSNTIVNNGGVTLGKGSLHASVDAIYEAYRVKSQGTNIITVGYELGEGNGGNNDQNIKNEITDPNNEFYADGMTLSKVEELFAGQPVDMNRVLSIYKHLSEGAKVNGVTADTDAKIVSKLVADVILIEMASINPKTSGAWYYSDIQGTHASSSSSIAATLNSIANDMNVDVMLEDTVPSQMSIIGNSIKYPSGVKCTSTSNRVTFKFDASDLPANKELKFSFDSKLDVLKAYNSVGFKSGDIIYTNGTNIKQSSVNNTLGSAHFKYLNEDLKIVSPTLKMIVQYDVILHPNKGDLNPSKNITKYDFGHEVELPKPPDIQMNNPACKGYEFVGWFEGGDRLATKISPTSMGTKEFWAKWAIIESDPQATRYALVNRDFYEIIRQASVNFKVVTINAPSESGGNSKRQWTASFVCDKKGNYVGGLKQESTILQLGLSEYKINEDIKYNYFNISENADYLTITATQNYQGTDDKVDYKITKKVPVRCLALFELY